ncbi:MAG: glycosyltransferase family 2 protein, partial [Nanoarchaeota archaeon]|nr:glycosyltransferase family 2 protein [Nanoarchaeota archaeon]
LQHTTGKFYACLDADSFVHPHALKEMLPYFADAEVAAVCPLLKVKNPNSILRKVQWHEYLINMFYKFLNAKLDCIHVTPGPFSVYRTSVVKTLGGYDEKTLTEDLEIAIRLQKHQYKIIQTFDAVVETVAPDTWRALFSQRIRWYKGSIDNAISYRKLMFNKAYGDFGFLRMPTIIITGAVALILIVTITQDALSKLGQKIVAYADINFDIITLLRNFRFEFNFLSLPFFKIFVAMVIFSLSFYVMIKSYQVVKEKITHYGRTWVSLLTYLFIYSIFISFVWLYIAFLFLTGKKKTWH